jgi:hypothetical protein
MVAIVATAPQSIEVPGTLESANEAIVQPFVSPNAALLTPRSQAVNFAPQSNRLNAYLLRHNQMAKTAGRQGFVSFVPIVATPVASATDESTDESKDESRIEDSQAELETTQNR